MNIKNQHYPDELNTALTLQIYSLKYWFEFFWEASIFAQGYPQNFVRSYRIRKYRTICDSLNLMKID